MAESLGSQLALDPAAAVILPATSRIRIKSICASKPSVDAARWLPVTAEIVRMKFKSTFET